MPEETVRELYTALPEQFTAARDAAAAAAKAAGHGAQATAIKRLRRPTLAAWLVNLLAHRAPERIGELTALAAELRDAQRQLRGADLRTLTVRRRELLSALAGQAADLAVQAQPTLSPLKLPLTEVEQTLAAALADDDIAAQVRAGAVVKAVSYTGFGAALPSGDEPDDNEPSGDAETGGRAAARGTVRAIGGRAATRTATRKGPAAATGGGTVARQGSVTAIEPARVAPTAVAEVEPPVPVGLRRELDAARDAERRARGEVATARAAEASAVDELAQLRDALAALEERRGRAQQEANGRRAARTAAERALAAAVRRTAKAQAAIDVATA
ncbi:hypothetical protein Cch02nite_50470 [Catellatospora chokoriensis]|uniref:Uncharacterized protein n=1 Tax=Catellatospora chokoriensis TaxID=310353 RepID=A0A8J3NTE6_9ACTN|nr:hypothetical protein Cch02nite_50470 [Catellatospora chokoriensis]